MMASQFILRVQSAKCGMKRVSSSADQTVEMLLNQVKDEFQLNDSNWKLWQNRNKSNELVSSTATLGSLNLKHGDGLFLEIIQDSKSLVTTEQSSVSSTSGMTSTSCHGNIVEDEVDFALGKLDGRIFRQMNSQLCRHGPLSKCFNCLPLDPYDEEYLSTLKPPIKFLSFHSHMRKINAGKNKDKLSKLENVNCEIKPGCRDHAPYPTGICSKCQPSSVILQRQKFRHVDFIQFENSSIANKFLDFWRKSGSQRIGFLYGTYEQHKDVPLGIKAIVSAIYEPPQISTKNSVELVEDERNDIVDSVAEKLGLRRVGWIFTDLVPLDMTSGTVKHYRNVETYFLSAEECIKAADFQNKYPNTCRFAYEGHFGSKFVTVAVVGDSTNQVHFDGYQVSNQCMALVRGECMVPTFDAPELGYIRESSDEQFVPDVFYSEKGEYGHDVSRLARPFPVDYLLQDIAVAFPKEQVFTFFAAEGIKSFPIGNRMEIGDDQTLKVFSDYMKQFQREDYMQAFSDFHLLVYLCSHDLFKLKDAMNDLFVALKTKNEDLLHDWLKSEAWGNVEQIMLPLVQTPQMNDFMDEDFIDLTSFIEWDCKMCTFINPPDNTRCVMCDTSRN